MAITLTERAAEEVKRIISEQKTNGGQLEDGVVLRMGVQGGGCSGFQYNLGFDYNPNPETDAILEQHGVTIVVDKRSQMYLDGTTVDFYDSVDRRGFKFENPNAARTCGCGSSFQV